MSANDFVPESWGHAWDNGYRAGRADALGGGADGLLAEIDRLRSALAFIGRKGRPLSGPLASRVARVALDRTSDETPEQTVEKNGGEPQPYNRKRRKNMWHEGRKS